MRGFTAQGWLTQSALSCLPRVTAKEQRFGFPLIQNTNITTNTGITPTCPFGFNLH